MHGALPPLQGAALPTPPTYLPTSTCLHTQSPTHPRTHPRTHAPTHPRTHARTRPPHSHRKAHIIEGHLAVARRDISRAATLGPSQKAVAALARDVERRISRRQKSDRKLAKEIGKWVSTAMDGGGGGGGGGAAAEAEYDF